MKRGQDRFPSLAGLSREKRWRKVRRCTTISSRQIVARRALTYRRVLRRVRRIKAVLRSEQILSRRLARLCPFV